MVTLYTTSWNETLVAGFGTMTLPLPPHVQTSTATHLTNLESLVDLSQGNRDDDEESSAADHPPGQARDKAHGAQKLHWAESGAGHQYDHPVHVPWDPGMRCDKLKCRMSVAGGVWVGWRLGCLISDQ